MWIIYNSNKDMLNLDKILSIRNYCSSFSDKGKKNDEGILSEKLGFNTADNNILFSEKLTDSQIVCEYIATSLHHNLAVCDLSYYFADSSSETKK